MTLSTNLIATGEKFLCVTMYLRLPLVQGLLAYRIWTVKRGTRHFSTSNSLTPLLRVVIESGAIYSMAVTCALITFVSKSNGVYVILDMVGSTTPLG